MGSDFIPGWSGVGVGVGTLAALWTEPPALGADHRRPDSETHRAASQTFPFRSMTVGLNSDSEEMQGVTLSLRINGLPLLVSLCIGRGSCFCLLFTSTVKLKIKYWKSIDSKVS